MPLIFFDCEWICTVFLFGIFAVRSLYPKTPSSLASFKSRLVLPFWYRLTQVAMEKRLLAGCSSSHWQQVRSISHSLDKLVESHSSWWPGFPWKKHFWGSYLACRVGGWVAEWLACWTQVQKGPCSNHRTGISSGALYAR